jgi:hypothetical protein
VTLGGLYWVEIVLDGRFITKLPLRYAFPRRSAPRHRLLRQGRFYGERVAEGSCEDGAPRGPHFLCLNADLERQIEFVRLTWIDPVAQFGALR